MTENFFMIFGVEFGCSTLGVALSKTDHLFGDVYRPTPSGSGGGGYTSLLATPMNSLGVCASQC